MRTILLGLVFLAACGKSGSTNPDAPGTGEDATTDGLPEGDMCGGFIAAQCAKTEYCDFLDNSCGIADGSGICRPRPENCPAVVGPPLCACDGKIHPGECVTYMSGFDLSAQGGCEVPKGAFECGYSLCTLQTQYCKHEVNPQGADKFTCVALPAVCTTAAPACACLKDERCGNACTGNATVGLTLTCP